MENIGPNLGTLVPARTRNYMSRSEITLVPEWSFPSWTCLVLHPISQSMKTNIHCLSKDRTTARGYLESTICILASPVFINTSQVITGVKPITGGWWENQSSTCGSLCKCLLLGGRNWGGWWWSYLISLCFGYSSIKWDTTVVPSFQSCCKE